MTTPLITTESAAHWYSNDGRPMHTIVGANGKERPTTLRDARKLHLLPSVTSILKVWPKSALDAWKQTQLVLAALTLPKLPEEALDAFAARVVEDSKQQAIKAAEFGKSIHKAIEYYHAGGEDGVTTDNFAFLKTYIRWATDHVTNVKFAEKILVNQGFYAGTADLLADLDGKPMLVDFKCRTVKDPSKPPIYDTDAMQLAAYVQCLEHDCQQAASVVINAKEPSEPIVRIWSKEELDDAWMDFEACWGVWCRANKWI